MIRSTLQRSILGLSRMIRPCQQSRTFLTSHHHAYMNHSCLSNHTRSFQLSFQQLRQPQRYLTTTVATTATTVTKPAVAYWLYFNASMVFTIVVVGGLTRLTESGLSITEWNVISGMKPPRSEMEWNEEFEKYKQFPEYKLLNRHMTLEEFKNIFYWEWSHRMIGRFIGVSFILPGLYFASKGHMSRRVAKQTLGITCLLGFQGFMGWYMVKSGLSEALMKEPGTVPRVSQYRLTAHLATAIAIYASTIFVAADIIRENKLVSGRYGQQTASMLNNPVLKRFRIATHTLGALMLVTVLSGGLVAGLDAGLIYNEFPFMGETIIPPLKELWSDDYVKPQDHGKWRNLLENPTTVQFDHRTLAETTATFTTVLWLYSKKIPLPKNARIAVNIMMGALLLQVSLGISTLLYMVPIELAAAHQAGALALLTSNFWLIHALRRVPL
ncbi:cytochrome oxidase assembly protein-domain-containing protein [Cokeromyces recurvatus]|uniref:cytochrome oxidase assembly protein-domain-containing protein n=1 Tax=Cokeromyces recurvatus TaxID=90255 RepID=UPI0022201948|nr:cytochrome oxidase assembly protein-domain-containing protein [Cokeromyces recurvatus]KAI7907016.1 cytochrome oxidase assembly protein-domain-containing protein [Cokeromyces recurvatus]